MRDIEGRRQGHIEKEGKQRRERVETEGRETRISPLTQEGSCSHLSSSPYIPDSTYIVSHFQVPYTRFR